MWLRTKTSLPPERQTDLRAQDKSREPREVVSTIACATGETRAKMGTVRIDRRRWSPEKKSKWKYQKCEFCPVSKGQGEVR